MESEMNPISEIIAITEQLRYQHL